MSKNEGLLNSASKKPPAVGSGLMDEEHETTSDRKKREKTN